MKKRLIIVAAAATAAAVIAGLVAVTTRRNAAPDPRSALPAVHQFAPGACRDAADAVVSLAGLTRRRDVATLSMADRAELRRLQDLLVTLRPSATGDVQMSMDELVLSLGYLRIRLDSKSAEPEYLHQAEQARSRLQEVCVHSPPGRGIR